jgi:hypothetical protein
MVDVDFRRLCSRFHLLRYAVLFSNKLFTKRRLCADTKGVSGCRQLVSSVGIVGRQKQSANSHIFWVLMQEWCEVKSHTDVCDY